MSPAAQPSEGTSREEQDQADDEEPEQSVDDEPENSEYKPGDKKSNNKRDHADRLPETVDKQTERQLNRARLDERLPVDVVTCD